ncbi:MAG: glycoside hydrolase family 9 protein [Bacteroidales bacterium]|nr:glycoside hydrolase family 9 protein [Bacteroidales bacterium]
MRNKILVLVGFVLSCMNTFSQPNGISIRVNQIGYNVDGPKTAFVANKQANTFEIKSVTTNSVVYTGKLSEGSLWDKSEEMLQCADFSDFKQVGQYYIACGDDTSFPFQIQEKNLYTDISKASIRAFYYWRASTELLPQHATWNGTDFSRPMGHKDDVVKIHSSAATKSRPKGTIVSASKGWYDAGDYNLYVVNAGISYHALAFAYEMMPEYYKSLNLNIPESGNGIPDILNELKWELDWLFAMQDEDGGVYTKLSSLRFCSMIMPHEDNLERYMIGKSTAAALDFAAMMAMASRIYKQYESVFPNISKKALTAAENAWNWAKKNPAIYFKNPSDVHTGGYGDSDMSDEFFWAAAEMYITTKEEKYYKELDFSQEFIVPEWGNVRTLGLMSLVLHNEVLPKEHSNVFASFQKLTNDLYAMYERSTHKVPIEKFNWGSNGVIASSGALLGLAFKEYGDEKYRHAMIDSWNYLLGCNPTGYCFISGFGSKYPRHFHDRRCTADGIEEPIPGYLAGGSTNYIIRDCGEKGYPSLTQAGCYRDAICSFSTNEIAINWNAPFALLAGMIEYYGK